MVTQMSYRNLQELVVVKGFMGDTRYFSGPMLCSVSRVVGKEVRPHNCSTKFVHGQQIYCMSFPELVVHRLVKVPWHLTVIQMLFTIMDYVFASVMIASYPGRMGEERPCIDCLRMRDHSQKNLGIRLRLETVGKINTYTSDIFPYHRKVQPFVGLILSTP